MKKRILSFLLVLCMLVAMVPVTAAVAEQDGSTESQADVAYVESYLDLYVTEGLTVLFDANSLSSDMITFGETAASTGTWYGYTVDATGKLVQNNAYAANPFGGAYNAETNPYGWQKLENGGIAWDEPMTQTKADYRVHFSTDWLGDAFEVELVYEPYLRDNLEGGIQSELIYDYWDDIHADGTHFIYGDDALKKPVDDCGIVWGGVALKDDNGDPYAYSYGFKRTSSWASGGNFANKGNCFAVHLAGSPNQVVTVYGTRGVWEHPDKRDENGEVVKDANGKVVLDETQECLYKSPTNLNEDGFTVTLDDEGYGVAYVPTTGSYVEIIVPTGVDIEKVEANIYLNQYAYGQTIVIGNLYGMIWNNKQASNTWGNGFGMARWTAAKNSWENPHAGSDAGNTNSDDNKAQLLDLNKLDDENFEAIDRKIVTMNVANTGSLYHLSYGSVSHTFTLDPNKKNAEGKYDGQDFKVLQQMGGAVYGMRLYKAPLTTAQKNQNHFADIVARYDLNVSTMELGNLSAYNYLFAAFANVALEGEDAEALQAKFNTDMANNPTKLQTEYDKLYVQSGLIALFSAYDNDASVDLTVGTWIDKSGNKRDAKFGGTRWAVNANGNGVGYALDQAAFVAEDEKKPTNYLSFGNEYFNMDDITFESVVMYTPITNGSGVQYNTQSPGLQLDLVQGNTFFDGATGFKYRMCVASYAWANHNGNNPVNAWSFGGVSGVYVGNGSSVPMNKIMNQTMVKDLEPETAYLRFTFDGAVYNTAGPQNAEGTFARSRYDNERNRYPHGSTTYLLPDAYTLFNHTPGSVYAVRIYDRRLDADEVKQNTLVDILAYAGYDLAKIDFEDILANGSLVTALMNGGIGQTATQIDETIAFYSQDITVEKNAYDKLYVDGGHLVALYSAYESDSAEGDSSLMVAGGKVLGWIDKVNQTIATVTGSFTANSNGDGGFGTDRWTGAQWDNEKASAGVVFDPAYVETDDFTVDAAIALNSVSDRTGTIYDGARTQMRIDLLALTTFIGNSGDNNHQIRGVFSYGNWTNNGGHNGQHDNVIGFYGETTGYRAGTFNFANGKVTSMTFIKDTNADTSIKLVFDFNGTRRANATITAAQYAQQKGYRTPTDGLFSLLNGTPGDLYAVRVYDVALTTAQQRQNKLVDLMAYTGADLTNYPTDPTQVALLADLAVQNGWDFSTANLKGAIEAVMGKELVSVTYKNALTDATLGTHITVNGEGLTLPSAFGNKVVVEWEIENLDDAVAAEGAAYSAVVIEKPTANNGVSVRVDGEDVGLRFTTVLDKASYGDLTIKYGAENVKIGMLVSTAAVVKKAGNKFTKDDIDLVAPEGQGYVDIAIDGYYKLTAEGDYELAGVLTNIKDSSLDAAKVAFVSVLYLDIDTDADGVTDVTIYGTTSEAKSVKAVADATKAAIDAPDTDSGLTAEAEATFTTWYNSKFPAA